MTLDRRGFTLIEILVVLVVFLIVLTIAGESFKTILLQSAKLVRGEESNIEGVIGLEMMRHDIQQAGYGLFTEPSPVSYSEAANAPASDFNETSNTAAPRAITAGNDLTGKSDSTSDAATTYNLLNNTDYLVIRGTTVGRDSAAQKWSHLVYASGSVTATTWASGVENFVANEKTILLQRTVTSNANTLSLVPDTSNNTFYRPYSMTAFSSYSTNTWSYFVYGLEGTATTPRMPFNRTDYFVASPSGTATTPQMCAPHTGTLYKTAVNQADGKLTYIPVMDCVADMQVVFGWDLADATGTLVNDDTMTGNGLIDTWSNADGSVTAGNVGLPVSSPPYVQGTILTDPGHIRTKLKVIKVYILAQIGRKDSSYTSPTPIPVIPVGDESGFNINHTLSSDMLNYRWKVYRVVVRPKNLVANQ